MRLGLLQFTYGRPEKNLARLSSLYQGLEVDLVVAPELALTSIYSPKPAEIKASLSHLHTLVCAQGVPLLIGGVEPEKALNVAYLLTPGGIEIVAEKVNLFPLFDKKVGFNPGDWPSPFDLGAWRVGVIICFDLRFPELVRYQAARGAEIICVIAAWPRERLSHFHALLKARAIENQVFVVGVNAWGRVGEFDLGGESIVFDPWGQELTRVYGESREIVELDRLRLEEAREIFVTPPAPPPSPERKILPLASLVQEAKRRRALGHKMVFTNGCFDLLHAGHVEYLREARKYGDFLVVGLNSDASVRRIKGLQRPINSQTQRALVLASLSPVDYVVFFEEDTPYRLIETLAPEVLVKGADWPEEKIVGADLVKARGGRVIRIPFKHQISTTQILQKILKEEAKGRTTCSPLTSGKG